MNKKQKKISIMAVKKLIKIFKTQKNLATTLGIAQPSIHLWLKKGCPFNRAVQLEELSGGEILRSEFRPDLYQSV